MSDHTPPKAVQSPESSESDDLIAAIWNGLDSFAEGTSNYELALRLRQTRDSVDEILEESSPSEKRMHMREAETAIERASRAADEEKETVDVYWNALLEYKQKKRTGS